MLDIKVTVLLDVSVSFKHRVGSTIAERTVLNDIGAVTNLDSSVSSCRSVANLLQNDDDYRIGKRSLSTKGERMPVVVFDIFIDDLQKGFSV